MKVSLIDIELAVDFVSSDYSFDSQAFLDTLTGKVYFKGDMVDEELPIDIIQI
jgi:hypothetical protein